jgi:hypothetical protein
MGVWHGKCWRSEIRALFRKAKGKVKSQAGNLWTYVGGVATWCISVGYFYYILLKLILCFTYLNLVYLFGQRVLETGFIFTIRKWKECMLDLTSPTQTSRFNSDAASSFGVTDCLLVFMWSCMHHFLFTFTSLRRVWSPWR